MAQGLLAGKRPASYLNLAGAALLLVTAVVYYLEATDSATFNAAVMACLVGAAACAAAFALASAKAADLGNLAAVGLVAYALGNTVIDNVNALIDMMTGISMFSGGADASHVFTLVPLMAAVLIVEIVSCFMSRDAQ